VKYEDWFDAECEHATTLKNRAYERMHQRNHTRNAVEEYHAATRQERAYTRRRRGNMMRINVGTWETLEV
jgi:hypothetical protein